jgi:hypothetical protein
MKLGLLAGTLAVAMLMAAGSTVALVEAIETASASAQASAGAALDFAAATSEGPEAAASRVADHASASAASWEAFAVEEAELDSDAALDMADTVFGNTAATARSARAVAFDAVGSVVAHPPGASVASLTETARQSADTALAFGQNVSTELQQKAYDLSAVGGFIAANAAGQANGAVTLAAGAAGAAASDPEGTTELAQAMAEQKLDAVHATASPYASAAVNLTSNVAGQANAAATLATFVATNLALALQSILAIETAALLNATAMPQCLVAGGDPGTCAAAFLHGIVEV